MSNEVEFYTNLQSRGAIVKWMLEEVGCEYETHALDYATSMKSETYLAINPMGKVPAIPRYKKVRFVDRSGYRLEIIFLGSQVSRVELPEGDWIDSSEVIVEIGSNFLLFDGKDAPESRPISHDLDRPYRKQ
jgi:hypothetical protein